MTDFDPFNLKTDTPPIRISKYVNYFTKIFSEPFRREIMMEEEKLKPDSSFQERNLILLNET